MVIFCQMSNYAEKAKEEVFFYRAPGCEKKEGKRVK